MFAYILRRLLFSIPVVILASFLLFAGVRSTFDPTARLRTSRDVETVQRERDRLGLDDPIVIQYRDWAVDFVQGDWGTSERTREEVYPMIKRAFATTIQLILWGVLISAFLAVVAGTYSAVKQYSWFDHGFTAASYVGLSLPPFVFGLLAIVFFSFRLPDWLGLDGPIFNFVGLHSTGKSGFNVDYLKHLALPVATLTVQIIASWSRFHRAAMLDVLGSEYIRTARAKGVPRRRVIFKHGLRNALIPLVTVMAVDSALLFGGLIITEQIFSIPGMGRLFLDALERGDVFVLEAWMVVVALFVITFNLLADVLYSVLDPRVRLS